MGFGEGFAAHCVHRGGEAFAHGVGGVVNALPVGGWTDGVGAVGALDVFGGLAAGFSELLGWGGVVCCCCCWWLARGGTEDGS